MNSPTSETLHIAEAAALLHADAETVMQFARRGELPGARIGRSWVFLREDVIAFLKAKIATETEARRRRSETVPALAVAIAVSAGRRRRELPRLPDLHAEPEK